MTSPLLPGTALVTGASSGIGAVYAEKLAQRGYDLVLVGRNAANLTLLAESLTAQTDRRVDVLVADLADSAGIAAVEARLRDDASLTLLVNNAGLAANGPLTEVAADALTDMLTVNVVALTRLAAAAGAAFSARKRGGIINLASAMAFLDTPRTAAYGASKAYVLNLTLSLDLELSPNGVQVQAVLPGYTRTPMIAGGANLPPEAVMETADLVDAALTGFDRRELVTIPSLEAVSAYDTWASARTALQPFLSLARPAARYAA
ncbi:SDR family NAD(P)-dependent oxidoreductase [Devosia sp. 2618]|uniref:SDR family NAD(P)-dependent oxidoreductase n=1 Tax=Devosia sp. 2618 TaxID=3156454 RepID=UPI003391F4D9